MCGELLELGPLLQHLLLGFADVRLQGSDFSAMLCSSKHRRGACARSLDVPLADALRAMQHQLCNFRGRKGRRVADRARRVDALIIQKTQKISHLKLGS